MYFDGDDFQTGPGSFFLGRRQEVVDSTVG